MPLRMASACAATAPALLCARRRACAALRLWRKRSALPRVCNTRRAQHELRQHELQNAPKPQSSQRRCTQVRTLRHTKAWLNQTRAENCSRPQTCWAETGKSLKMQRNRNKKLTAGMWRLRSVRHTRARRDKRGSNMHDREHRELTWRCERPCTRHAQAALERRRRQ